MSRILLVEDSRGFAEMLRMNLELEGHTVTIASAGDEGLERAKTGEFELIILDLMLPAMNGFTLLQRLRDSDGATAVIIMSALGAEDDKLRGFGLGSDDYIVKGTGLLEVLARVRAVLSRRTGGRSDTRQPERIADLTVDFDARTVTRAGATLPVRPKEFDLLAALLRRRGKAVSRRQLLLEVWGYASDTESRTLETHLGALRQHIDDDPQQPKYILTVRGVGYRIP